MALLGRDDREAKFHEELKYLAASIESINQQLSSVPGGSDTESLQKLDRRLYTIFNLLQESEKRSASRMDTQIAQMNRSQHDAIEIMGREISKMGEDVSRMRSSQETLASTVSELVKILRDQVALSREQLESMRLP